MDMHEDCASSSLVSFAAMAVKTSCVVSYYVRFKIK